MFNFITLTITIWTQAKHDYNLLHDSTKFQVQKTFRYHEGVTNLC